MYDSIYHVLKKLDTKLYGSKDAKGLNRQSKPSSYSRAVKETRVQHCSLGKGVNDLNDSYNSPKTRQRGTEKRSGTEDYGRDWDFDRDGFRELKNEIYNGLNAIMKFMEDHNFKGCDEYSEIGSILMEVKEANIKDIPQIYKQVIKFRNKMNKYMIVHCVCINNIVKEISDSSDDLSGVRRKLNAIKKDISNVIGELMEASKKITSKSVKALNELDNLSKSA